MCRIGIHGRCLVRQRSLEFSQYGGQKITIPVLFQSKHSLKFHQSRKVVRIKSRLEGSMKQHTRLFFRVALLCRSASCVQAQSITHAFANLFLIYLELSKERTALSIAFFITSLLKKFFRFFEAYLSVGSICIYIFDSYRTPCLDYDIDNNEDTENLLSFIYHYYWY